MQAGNRESSAHRLLPGDTVPGGVVVHVETCARIGQVAVWLRSGRVLVYLWNEHPQSVWWWIGTSNDCAHHRLHGPFDDASQAAAELLRIGIDSEIFALPKSQR